MFGALAWAGGAIAAEPPDRPNIVLILADDLGAGDLGCYNAESKVPTPNLDRLARDGIRFTNAYCPDAVCTPSRYALMTGRYSWRSPLKAGVQGNWEKPLIEEGRLTLPALLQRAGYATGGFGKWHLGAEFPTADGRAPEGQGVHRHPTNGANLDLAAPLGGGPADRGFDTWYGFICTSESLIYEGRHPVGLVDVYPVPLAAGADQLPVIPLSTYLDVVTDRSLAFIDARARAARAGQPFFVYYSPYVPHIPLAVPEEFKGTTSGGAYGDYVHALDHHVGRLLAALERHGLAENTLVIFASDNGSEFVNTGEGHRPNGVFRGRKWDIFEGGVRSPLIARWPKNIPAGATSSQLASLVDMPATLAPLTGQTLPAEAAEDSFNLLPAFLGADEGRPIRDSLVLKAAAHQLGLRSGQWKYIDRPMSAAPSKSDGSEGQLYDLNADPAETTDLVARHPEIAVRLKAELDALVAAPRTAPAGVSSAHYGEARTH